MIESYWRWVARPESSKGVFWSAHAAARPSKTQGVPPNPSSSPHCRIPHGHLASSPFTFRSAFSRSTFEKDQRMSELRCSASHGSFADRHPAFLQQLAEHGDIRFLVG